MVSSLLSVLMWQGYISPRTIHDSPVFRDFYDVKDSRYKKIREEALKLPKTYDWVDRMNDLRPLCNANPNDPVLAYKYGQAVLCGAEKFDSATGRQIMREAAYYMVRPNVNPKDVHYTRVAFINACWFEYTAPEDSALRMLRAFPDDRLVRQTSGWMLGLSKSAQTRALAYKVLKEDYDKAPSVATSWRVTLAVYNDAWATKSKARAAEAIRIIDEHARKYPDDVPDVWKRRRQTMQNIVDGVKDPGKVPGGGG